MNKINLDLKKIDNFNYLINKRIAIFIDADNFSHNYIENILNELNSFKINIKRAYSNWLKPHMIPWNEIALTMGISKIQQDDLIKGKNLTDFKMLIDIMETLYTKDIDTFIIFSSDSDFTPLYQHLRENNKEIILFYSQDKISKELNLSMYLDHFYNMEIFDKKFYSKENIEKKYNENNLIFKEKNNIKYENEINKNIIKKITPTIKNKIKKLVKLKIEENNLYNTNNLLHNLQEIKINYKDYGFHKFHKFLEELKFLKLTHIEKINVWTISIEK